MIRCRFSVKLCSVAMLCAGLLLANEAAADDPVAATPAAATSPAPSFLAEVVPLLTRAGCNQGACHGKNAGQNGFRLSLRGYAPEQDWVSIVRELQGRRISRTSPAESLMLTKPLGEASHGGGKVFARDSRDYALLLHWIESGAPGPLAAEPVLSKIAIRPGDRVARVGEQHQLAVVASYTPADATNADNKVDAKKTDAKEPVERDVTWLARFDTNDASVVTVDKQGLVTVRGRGETTVRVSFRDQVAVVTFTVPRDAEVPAELLAARNNFIDEHIFHKLGELRIAPSGPASDAEFLRRVTLDLIGTLPTPDEVTAFLADARPDKRTRLVDSLFDRPEFVDYWTLEIADLLQNRKERDHDVRGAKGVRALHAWIRQQVAANRPWNEFVRDVLTARGPSASQPAVGYYIVNVGEERHANNSDIVASTAQAFLGTRIGCAKCHNHPLERYTQDDYYHYAAFFSRIKFERKEPKDGDTLLLISHADEDQNAQPIGVVQPRTGKFLAPQTLDRHPSQVRPSEDPRVALADWITDPSNEAFSGAIVNRIWRHFLGVGLVEPVDDLRASNPPSNIPLWQALNRDFVAGKFDLRRLMRAIVLSRVYQLSSTTSADNETDSRFYSHFLVRRIPAEPLLDAVSQVCQSPQRFDGYPVGIRAIQLADPGVKTYFLSVFGRSDRVTACACERGGEVTLPQLLHLQNGDDMLAKIRAADGRTAQLLKKHSTNGPLIDELFLAALGRSPSDEQLATIEQAFAAGPREEVAQDILWALLNSKEFAFNH